MMAELEKREMILRGIGVSPGISMGNVYLLDRGRIETTSYRYIESPSIPFEIERFKNAIKRSKEQLCKVKERILETRAGRDHAYIINAHIMILEDNVLTDDTVEIIEEREVNAEWAFKMVLKKFLEMFNNIDDEYLRERASDIEHIEDMVLRNLMGEHHESITEIEENSIVVSHDLSPADTAQMTRDKVLAFATDIGGKTSHTAIMARSLDIPAVVGLDHITRKVEEGDFLVIDGTEGRVVINPSEVTQEQYLKKQRQYRYYEKEFLKFKDLPAVTMDGKKIDLLGNIEFVEELPSLLDHGAEGVGLYRTEFLYITRKDLPTEEEHIETYTKAIKMTDPFPVTIRTLDIGGDKFLTPINIADEMNPAMGLRAIRFCLKMVDIFKVQLRGILRASVHGKVKIMFPMISGVEELRKAKEVLEEVKGELSKDGIPFDRDISIGIMIEVPSAAIIADVLAKEVDFFSIGTNDLIQYSLAIDRINEHVAYLYEPLHPAILRTIKNVVDAADEEGIEVGICGEMAGDPEYAVVLLGLGLNRMSMNAISIPRVKQFIRATNYRESQEMAAEVLNLSTVSEVKEYLKDKMEKVCKEGYKEEEMSFACSC
ncbi:MAG: phosphoenolpyruvate--protein phosphotransferase [Thermodesulfobacteriota bacterium]